MVTNMITRGCLALFQLSIHRRRQQGAKIESGQPAELFIFPTASSFQKEFLENGGRSLCLPQCCAMKKATFYITRTCKISLYLSWADMLAWVLTLTKTLCHSLRWYPQ